MKPGEIYWAELDSGRRAVAVVSRETLNRGAYVQVVPFTSTQLSIRARLPNCVPFKAGDFGLPKDCAAQCEMLTTIEKTRLDSTTGIVGNLDEQKFREMVRALGYAFCAQCEPD